MSDGVVDMSKAMNESSVMDEGDGGGSVRDEASMSMTSEGSVRVGEAEEVSKSSLLCCLIPGRKEEAHRQLIEAVRSFYGKALRIQ